jgi:serine/threonine protein kinase
MSATRDPAAVEYPFLPSNVNPTDLRDNGFILSDEEIERLKLLHKNSPNGSYPETPYEIIKIDGQIYAVYRDAIAEGNYGQINPLQNLTTGKWYVLKTQNYQTDIHRSTLETECKILYDLHRSPMRTPCIQGPNVNNLKGFIIMDYVKGEDLKKLHLKRVNKEIRYPDLFWLKIVNALLTAAIDDLRLYLNCDIKLENVMCHLGKLITFIDFGFGVKRNDEKLTRQSRPLGTAGYHAPECNRRPYPVSIASEIYSLGTLIKEILQGWSADPEIAESVTYFYGQVTEPTVFYPVPDADNFLRRLRSENATDHPTEAEAVIFLKNADESKDKVISFIRQMRSSNPADRPTLDRVITFFKQLEEKYVKEHPEEEAKVRDIQEQAKKDEHQRLANAYKHVDIQRLLNRAKMVTVTNTTISKKADEVSQAVMTPLPLGVSASPVSLFHNETLLAQVAGADAAAAATVEATPEKGILSSFTITPL